MDHSAQRRHSRGWTAQLVYKGRGCIIIKMQLTYEEHTIDCRMLWEMGVPIVVRLDGKVVASIFERDTESRMKSMRFYITDRADIYEANFDLLMGSFDSIRACNLSIGGSHLYGDIRENDSQASTLPQKASPSPEILLRASSIRSSDRYLYYRHSGHFTLALHCL
jgi:hypothetical protein